jgi:hypothetical protein
MARPFSDGCFMALSIASRAAGSRCDTDSGIAILIRYSVSALRYRIENNRDRISTKIYIDEGRILLPPVTNHRCV